MTACFKERYKSRARAERGVKLRMRSTPGCPPLRVYECPFCHGWHMTSKPRTQ